MRLSKHVCVWLCCGLTLDSHANDIPLVIHHNIQSRTSSFDAICYALLSTAGSVLVWGPAQFTGVPALDANPLNEINFRFRRIVVVWFFSVLLFSTFSHNTQLHTTPFSLSSAEPFRRVASCLFCSCLYLCWKICPVIVVVLTNSMTYWLAPGRWLLLYLCFDIENNALAFVFVFVLFVSYFLCFLWFLLMVCVCQHYYY